MIQAPKDKGPSLNCVPGGTYSFLYPPINFDLSLTQHDVSSEYFSHTDPHITPSGSELMRDLEMLDAPQVKAKNDVDLAPIPNDLADEIEGMYRLMDLISESGSHGYGKETFMFSIDNFI